MNPLIMVDFTLFLLTWNVKDSDPGDDYGDLLNNAFTLNNGAKDPEIIAIGLQEVSFKLLGPEPWIVRTKELLKDRNYVLFKKNQLVGILLMVLVKRDLILDFRNIRLDYTKTGLRGLWGNKGAVSVRFDYKTTSLCFINSHLAAHDHNLETRIGEYKKIYYGQSFYVRDPDRSLRIEDHDVALWMGDLNFRLDELTGQEILQKIVLADLSTDPIERQNFLKSIQRYDQISIARKFERAFDKFSESEITFSPTYKFKPWSNEYDLSRKPAWCDRILYRTREKESAIKLTPQIYRSHPDFFQSDHKPVSSFFSVYTPRRFKRQAPALKLKFLTPTDWRIKQDSYAYYTVDGLTEVEEPHPKADEEKPLESSHKSRVDSTDPSSKLSEFDWIGLFPEDFTDLGEHTTFAWVSLERVPNLPHAFIRQEQPSISSLDYVASSSSSIFDRSIDMGHNVSALTAPLFRVKFSELTLLIPGRFRLLYFNKDGDVLAISEPFEIKDELSD